MMGNARIEQGVDQIHNERAESDNQYDDKDDAADKVVIESRNRFEKQGSEARISEHHFYQNGPRNNLS